MEARIATAQVRIRILVAQPGGADPDRVRAHELGLGPELTNQSDLRFDVADSRHVAQRHLLVGEERGSQDRQRGVLVAARFQRPRDGPAPLDHELGAGHVSGCGHWMSS